MATTKKQPATKKSATVKKAPVRKTTKKVAKTAEIKSFRRAKEQTPFLTFKPSTQTIYWLILSAFVIALGVWVMYLTAQVQAIYDQVDANTSALDMTPHAVEKEAKKQ